MGSFAFDENFQRDILALSLQKFDFLLFCSDLVKPDYFEGNNLIFVYQQIISYYRKYGKTPTTAILRNELKKAIDSRRIRESEEDSYLQVIEDLDRPVHGEEYVRDEITRFCRRQAVKQEFYNSVDLLDSNDDAIWDTIVNRVRDACQVGTSEYDDSIHYFRDYQERLDARLRKEDPPRLPTGIKQLDYHLNGGLKRGQLGIFMAGTGRGKSLALSHVGKRCVIGGGKVLHITLELDDEDIAERYDAAWTITPIFELETRHERVNEKLGKLARKYDDNLIIKQWPTNSVTVDGIRSYLLHLRAQDFYPDMVIVDYGDLIKPTTNYNDEYSDLGYIFKALRGLAGEFGVVLWTATQVNRSGLQAEVLGLEHVSDSLKKLFVADVVIAVCMTNEEKANNKARLVTPKNRNGPDWTMSTIATDYKHMIFYSTVASDALAERGEVVEKQKEVAKDRVGRRRKPIERKEI